MGILKCCGSTNMDSPMLKGSHDCPDKVRLEGCGSTNMDSPMLQGSHDCPDKVPNSSNVGKGDTAAVVHSAIIHCVDVVCDIYMAYSYFATGKVAYGASMTALIVVPSIVLSLISIKMYLQDLSDGTIQFRGALLRIILCLVGLPIQAAPLIRIFDSRSFAKKSVKAAQQCNLTEEQRLTLKEEYYKKMLNEDSDLWFLKVFEGYLESAPQLTLQIALLIMDYIQGSYVHSFRQMMTIIFGLLSLGACMTGYSRCIRFDQETKANLSPSGLIFHFLWQLFFTVSRILAIALVASLYAFWTSVAVGIHWCAMFIWLAVHGESNFCSSKILEVFFALVVGAVYIFNFLNLKDRPTKYHYLFLYSLIFVENTVAVAIWGNKFNFRNWFYYFFTILPPVCFVLSVVFMIMYYRFFHPSLSKSAIKNHTKCIYCNAEGGRLVNSCERGNS